LALSSSVSGVYDIGASLSPAGAGASATFGFGDDASRLFRCAAGTDRSASGTRRDTDDVGDVLGRFAASGVEFRLRAGRHALRGEVRFGGGIGNVLFEPFVFVERVLGGLRPAIAERLLQLLLVADGLVTALVERLDVRAGDAVRALVG